MAAATDTAACTSFHTVFDVTETGSPAAGVHGHVHWHHDPARAVRLLVSAECATANYCPL